jgi:hypothetical protein
MNICQLLNWSKKPVEFSRKLFLLYLYFSPFFIHPFLCLLPTYIPFPFLSFLSFIPFIPLSSFLLSTVFYSHSFHLFIISSFLSSFLPFLYLLPFCIPFTILNSFLLSSFPFHYPLLLSGIEPQSVVTERFLQGLKYSAGKRDTVLYIIGMYKRW